MLKKFATPLLIVAALAAVVGFAPMMLQAMTHRELSTVNSLVDRIWWPATAVRLGVYGLLSWGLFPLLVRGRLHDAQTAKAVLADASDPAVHAEYERGSLRECHLQRVLTRSPWVFLALVVSDLMIAQLPYGLLRGF